MTTALPVLRTWIDAACEGRQSVAAPVASMVAGLPWVHRSGKRGAPAWLEILRNGRIGAHPTTEAERAAGVERAAYFFLGSGAYPSGLVAFLVGEPLEALPGCCTPIDTGGLLAGRMVQAHGQTVQGPEAVERWQAVRAAIQHARALTRAWVAAHLHDPMDYVRRSLVSEPDVPAIHGLRSPEGLRLAWTVEAQVEADVPLAGSLAVILFARRGLFDSALLDPAIDGAVLALAVVPADEDEYGDADFDRFIAAHIERRLAA